MPNDVPHRSDSKPGRPMSIRHAQCGFGTLDWEDKAGLSRLETEELMDIVELDIIKTKVESESA